MFDIVTSEAITSGRATDAYFDRTEKALDHADQNPRVVAEVSADQFPDGDYEVLAGLKDAAMLFEGLPVDIDAQREGALFDGGPVMRIEGNYLDFARYETAMLGFLSHASGVATKALEATVAAQEFDDPPSVLSFGARHVHPAIAAMVERSALIGGADGFSHVAAGDILGRDPSGTMPHALILSFGPGEQEAAWRAFDEAVPDEVPRIALVDTFTDEKDEAIRAAEELGDRLDGIRLDTTGSRRGDFRHIIKEVRWALDSRGREDVDIYVSGGLGPADIRELGDLVDGFGVGGYISNADPVDFGLDIVEAEGVAFAKRGKNESVKAVVRDGGQDYKTVLRPRDEVDPDDDLLEPLIRDGEVVRDFDIDDAAELALAEADVLDFEGGAR